MTDHTHHPERPPNELLDLLWDLYEDNLDLDKAKKLSDLLAANADNRRNYVAFMELIAALEWNHANGDEQTDGHERDAIPPALAAPVDMTAAGFSSPLQNAPLTNVPVIGPPADPSTASGGLFASLWTSNRRWDSVPLFGSIMAIVVLVTGGIFFYRSNVGLIDNSLGKPIAVAHLQEDYGCVWGEPNAAPRVSAELGSGQRLELREGVVKLLFRDGAMAVIQGPALFELVAADSMRLDRGTVAVRSDGDVKEFIVTSPKASIIDLGTSFGVHCDEKGDTEVEVFEGAVEVRPQDNPDDSRILGVGGSAQVRRDGASSKIDITASEVDRFPKVLELLWAEMSRSDKSDSVNDERTLIQAEFNDAPIPGTVDTFYGAARGRGWLTPWVASGNPVADVPRDDSQFGDDDPMLRLKFHRSRERTIAREYGALGKFDPSQPHVISWRWRFDGNLKQFSKDYRSRVHFYGNSFFRRNSFETNSWLIGVVAGNDISDKHPRKVFPMHWYAFDGQDGSNGKELDLPNLIDSGMKLKPNVVYHFAVAVYPQQARYDVAIRDNEQTFIRTGLNFRNRSKAPSNVVHFGICNGMDSDDLGFSLDSVRIEPLPEGGVQGLGETGHR